MNLQPAIDYFGSLNKVGPAIGLSKMAGHQWKERGLPPERAVELSKAAKGSFKPSDLLPEFEWT
jgi:DNA-binding transcriptional regulator YdaS (Cro superfamily)